MLNPVEKAGNKPHHEIVRKMNDKKEQADCNPNQGARDLRIA